MKTLTDNSNSISIILPTYNRSKLLLKAIQSVLDQTLQEWELIIWDDGSTDETKDILSKLNDPRVSYFYSENRGAAAARNSALKKARGEYIAFIDSDDQWLPVKLLMQVQALDKFPGIDLLFTDFENINLKRNLAEKVFVQNSKSMQRLNTTRLDEALFLINSGLNEGLAQSNFVALDSVMLRRNVFDHVGLFNENLRNSEDLELWWRMGLEGVRFAYLDKVLMNRFKPPDSLSSPSVLASQNTLKALNLCQQRALEKGRDGLARSLRNRYRNTWQNLIISYGAKGNKKQAINAFMNSLKYGFRLGSMRLLLGAFRGSNYKGSIET